MPPLNFTPITFAVNHLLAQEPWARHKLATHASKTVCIDSGALVLKWHISADGLLQAPPAEIVPNVTIRLKLSNLSLMAQNPDRAFSYVTIQGDADLANVISQVGRGLRWDAEQDVSKLVGDIAAVRLVEGAKAIASAIQITHKKLAENLAEYFLEEKPLLVRPHAIFDFMHAATTLRDDVERLIKRIERIAPIDRTYNAKP
ncbi:MAG: sterol-binding protein [Glaciimonas sp.]|nr:sterol-binding protein [Glaciimonas sp.]